MAAAEYLAIDSRLVDPLTPDYDSDSELSTIEDFLEFSTAELKHFLLNMGESIAGCRAELAERAVFAQQRMREAGPSEPKKFKIERAEAKGEYASMLEEYGLTDPDVAGEWSVDISGLPSLDVGKIFHYILTKEAFDTYYLSEYRTKKAYQYLEAVCVRSIQVHATSDFIFAKGTIAPLNKTGGGYDAEKDPNIVKLLTTSDNDIVVSCCSCTSDLYQCCNHVIAVLFRIERLVREMDMRDPAGKMPEPGPELQEIPRPVKISELFQKDPLSQTLTGKIHKPSADEKRRFMEKICQTLPNSLFAQMFKGIQVTKTITVTSEAQLSAGHSAGQTTVTAQGSTVYQTASLTQKKNPATKATPSPQVLPASLPT